MSAKITKATNSVMNLLLKFDNLLLVVGKKIL